MWIRLARIGITCLLIAIPFFQLIGQDLPSSEGSPCCPSIETAARVPVRGIYGQVVDFTANHGVNRRIFSQALGCERDLYVYLPPCFDAKKPYPVMIYLHGVLQDEKSFIEFIVKPLDKAIRTGQLPPMIVAAPDGSIEGNPTRFDPGSFYINGPRGRYQDWILQDVWSFLHNRFLIRPEPKAHILCGVSMGGFGAYNMAIKHPEQFGIVVGVMPALNLRWMGCCGGYFANFSPNNWCWRDSFDNPREVIGEFGIFRIRIQNFAYPVFGQDPQAALALVSQENPIEMLDRYKLKHGMLDMFIGYGAYDEFNLDAQVESFLSALESRNIGATVQRISWGRHDEKTALCMLPKVVRWLDEKLRQHNVAD